jgi:hypothetical protein
MKTIELISRVVEFFMYVSLPIFASSTLYLISVVKKKNYKFIKNAVTNPVIPNIDMRFFKNLQNEYLSVRKNKIPAFANRISFSMLIFGFILLFFLVILQELIRS